MVLAWNQCDLTLGCLRSLSSLIYPNYQVLVVDNGSDEQISDCIGEDHPGVKVIRNSVNLGFAEGNNVGIRAALEADSEYVLILNNDTLVSPTMLTELISVMEAKPEVGMAGPLMYCFTPSDSLFAAGSFIRWSKGDLQHRGMFQPASRMGAIGRPEPVDFIVGCGVLVKRQMIEQAGMFEPMYYMNYEDVDWGLRARRMGFEVWFVPQAVMWHKVSASLGPESPAKTYYMTRNALYFFWKNSPQLWKWPTVTRILSRTVRSAGAWSLRDRYRAADFKRRRQANLHAIGDFFAGRMGRMAPELEHALSSTR